MSTFSGLSRAASALYAQQRALEVTGQNIANVNTDGYSRQRAELQSVGGSVVPAIWSTGNDIGQGVTADQVTRIRDVFLEVRSQTERGVNSRLAAESTSLERIETAFREPGETGLQRLMSDTWKSWGDVQNGPKNVGARSAVLENTQKLVMGLQTTRAALDGQWTETRENLAVQVNEVNSDAASVLELNQAIKRATVAGLPANELQDKRDVLVQKLASSIGATSSQGPDGSMTVSVGGSTIVSGQTQLKLELVGPADPDTATPLKIVASPGTWPLPVGGTAAGQLAALGPSAPQSGSIKTYRANLDALAADLAAKINAAHTNTPAHPTYDLAGNPGVAMLATNDGSATVTAKNISLAFTDPARLAAAKYPPAPPAGASTDTENAQLISKLGTPQDGPDATYRALIVNLGVQSAVATRNAEVQGVITAQVDRSRESVSGVSLDEEMTNMLAFQHAYAAAGRLVSAIDETLDILINRTGLVGR
jgi:flagellar hook-associated protein 1 FlgK